MSDRVIDKTHELIVNNDMAVIDFLADLEDRQDIHVLTECLEMDKSFRTCFVTYHSKEKLITVILANDPFGLNENSNILTLFYTTSDKLSRIGNYFIDWLRITDYSEMQKRIALREIIDALSDLRHIPNIQNTQTAKSE
jgi:hypothetical protein